MLKMSVKIPEGVKRAGSIMDEELKLAMNRSTSEIEQLAKNFVPVATGNLRRSIQSDITPLGFMIGGIVEADMKQASYAADVEYGTGIYSTLSGAPMEPIRPKHAKALAFMKNRKDARPSSPEEWRNAVAEGRAIITKSIKGMRPHPYMHPAFEAGKTNISRNIEEAVTRAKARMNG